MNDPTVTLTEEEQARRGRLIAEALRLKQVPQGWRKYTEPMYQTQLGKKTALGIFRAVVNIALDGE